MHLIFLNRDYSKAAMHEPMNTEPRGYIQMGNITVGGFMVRYLSRI